MDTLSPQNASIALDIAEGIFAAIYVQSEESRMGELSPKGAEAGEGAPARVSAVAAEADRGEAEQQLQD
jgi:hypothetical protein